MDNTKYNIIVQKIALKYNLPVTVAKKIIESQFEFINETVKNLDFKQVKSKEEFDKLQTNFTVKYLFTLYASYNKIDKINKRRNEAKNKDVEEC